MIPRPDPIRLARMNEDGMSLGNSFGHQPEEFECTQPRRVTLATSQDSSVSDTTVSRADQQLWADEGGIPRSVVFKRHDLDFENAIDIEKIDAMLAWNDR